VSHATYTYHRPATHFPGPGDWAAHPDRACAHVDPELFFPVSEVAGRYDPAIQIAKALCRTCPVITPCREYALATPTLQGIWGATTDKERRKIRRGGT